MAVRRLGSRSYLLLLAIAAYLLVSTATASQDAPSWLTPLVLLLASLAFADLRLQVGKFQTQVPLSELLVVSVLPAASPLMGGFFALCATGGRAVLEQKTNRDWTEFSIKLAASGLAAISGLALAGSVAGGATGTFGLIMLALWYLTSVSTAESIAVGLRHWRRHLPSNLRKALLGAVAFAPVVFVLVKATEPQANPMVWICFPILIAMYWYIDVRYGEMVVDLRRADELHELYAPAVQALAIAMDAKDSVSSDHVKRVQKYCIEVGKALNCSAAELQALEFGALLHDIGKIAIPDIVLTKPGRLSPEEFSQMATHPQIGAEIISAVEFPFPVADLVLSHHENWDGSGYPRNLRGDEIPITARILSVVDTFDALTTDRPYRAALSVAEAIAMIRSRSGQAFDPTVAEALIELLPTLQVRSEIEALESARTADIAALAGAVGRPKHVKQTSLTYQERIESLKQNRVSSRQNPLTQQFTAYARLLKAAGPTLSPSEILRFLSPILRDSTAFEKCGVLLMEGRELVPVFFSSDDGDELGSIRVPLDDSPSGWAASHGESLLNADPTSEFGELGSVASAAGLSSMIATPLWRSGKVVGVLNVYSTSRAAYDQADVAILEAFAPSFGEALHRSWSFDHSGQDSPDGLTIAPGPRETLQYLRESLTSARAFRSTVSVVYIDVDDLSMINAHRGHRVGDELLVSLHLRILNETDADEDFVGRLGGDHFVVVQRDRSERQLDQLVRRLRLAAVEVLDPDGSKLADSQLSIGFAKFPADADSAESLLLAAARQSYGDKMSKRSRGLRDSGTMRFEAAVERRAQRKPDAVLARRSAR